MLLITQVKINLASHITCIKEPKKQPVLEMNLAINLLLNMTGQHGCHGEPSVHFKQTMTNPNVIQQMIT